MKYTAAILLILLMFACRKDQPPPQSICALNGFGAGNCTMADGSHKYMPPSEMLNWVARSPEDEKAWDAWCYGVKKDKEKEAVGIAVDRIIHEAHEAQKK